MNDDLIDIISLIKKVLVEKKFIIKFTIISFVLGCIISLTIPVKYVSQTTFVPQTADSNIKGKSLGSLASLAGINLNTESNPTLERYISPLLYSKIIESHEFSETLLYEEINLINGEKLSVKNYLIGEDVSGVYKFLDLIKKYTIGLFTIEKKEIIPDESLNDFKFISDEDFAIIKQFKEKFSMEANEDEGYIRVTASDKDAFISMQLVQLITKNLQSSIISLRTKKMLESEFNIQKNILMSLASEYNSNKIKLNKNTPIFSVLDEVSVPNERTQPKRKNIAILFTILGTITSIIYILSKEFVFRIYRELTDY